MGRLSMRWRNLMNRTSGQQSRYSQPDRPPRMRNKHLRCMERSINRAVGAISYLPRWAHILALVESLVLVAILVLVDIFLPGWDWIVLLWLPIAIVVSLFITKRKTRERKRNNLKISPLQERRIFFANKLKKRKTKWKNREQTA